MEADALLLQPHDRSKHQS